MPRTHPLLCGIAISQLAAVGLLLVLIEVWKRCRQFADNVFSTIPTEIDIGPRLVGGQQQALKLRIQPQTRL
ncbi:hypothetical protein D3C80_1010440 [compost metagenome]